MTQDEKAFFQQLGARIAELRKSAAITQVQLSDTLGVSQQTVASWEVGRRGVPVATLPALARALCVGVETLIGEKAASAKRGPAPQLQQRIERLIRLPKAQQRLVLQMLDGVLSQSNR
ncbi:MAG: helix-turn-helix domain-containing protein [Gammaproteobacteria bacterium]